MAAADSKSELLGEAASPAASWTATDHGAAGQPRRSARRLSGAAAPHAPAERGDSTSAISAEAMDGSEAAIGTQSTSSDLGATDVIFSYDSLWNDESKEAWDNEQELRFQDLERATDAAMLQIRRRRVGAKVSPEGGDPVAEGAPAAGQGESMAPAAGQGESMITMGLDSAISAARMVGHVAKTDPASAAFVTRMLSTHVEPESLAGSNIHMSVCAFLEQLFVQIFFPLNLPILWCCFKPAFARNMSMACCGTRKAPGDPVAFGVFAFLNLTSMALLATFLSAPHLVPSVFRTEVFAIMVSFLLQKYVIAVKYSSLPPAAYEAYQTRDIPARVRRAEQLIAGWLRPSSVVVAREILEASVRLGIDLQSSKFTFRPSAREAVARYFHSVDRLVPARMRVEFDERFEIPMLYVIYAILAREVVRRKPKKVVILSVVLGAGVAALFPAMRYLQGLAPFGTGGLDTAACIVSFVVASLWYVPLFQFLGVAIVDYSMRCKTLGLLGAVMSRKRERSDGRFYEPVIDLRVCPGNISAFVLARRLLLNVGLRYQLRLQNYTNVVALLNLGLGVATFVMTLTGTSTSAYGAFEVYTVVMLVASGLLLAFMVFSGSSANRRSDEHLALLSARQLETRQQIVAFRTLLMSMLRTRHGLRPAYGVHRPEEEGGPSKGAAPMEALSRMGSKQSPRRPTADPSHFSHKMSGSTPVGASRLSDPVSTPTAAARSTSRKRRGSVVGGSRPRPSHDAEATEVHLTATQLLELAHEAPDVLKSDECVESDLQWSVSHFEDIDALFEPAKEALRADAELHPVRLLGLPATATMLRSGAVLLLTCVSLGARLVLQA